MTARAPDELGELIASIRACGRSRDINKAKHLHAQAILKGSISNKYVANCLITLYAKCRSAASAARVFDSMITCDLVSWNALLQGYVACEEIQAALELFQEMIFRDGRSYVAALNACTSLLVAAAAGEEVENEKNKKVLKKARAIHREAVNNRCCDSFVKSSLVNFYSRAGRMKEAQQVFDEMHEQQRDTVAWNTLLQGYVANGESELALELLEQNPISRDARTFLIALNAVANLSAAELTRENRTKWLARGRALHSQALESGCCDMFVESMAIDVFGKCGSMDDARRVFDRMKSRNSVSWTALMNGYISNDSSEIALELFEVILRTGKCPADARVFVAALTACACLGSKEHQTSSRSFWLKKGREIQTRCSLRDLFVETALINMYAQCGSMTEARGVFEKMAKRSPVSWNSLIQGYADNGENHSALKAFCEMDLSGTPPTSATFVAALTACKNSMLVAQAIELHSEIEARSGVDSGHSHLANSLIEFYSRAGRMDDAERIFTSIPLKETSSWNSLMGGYSQRGDNSRALGLFQQMRERGVSPDKITFSHLLSACSHAGLTDEARSLFAMMRDEFRIEPDAIHYTCMVDLLCRANCSGEAERMLSGMPERLDNIAWSTLLSSSAGGKPGIGELAFESLMKLDENDASAYVSLARVYRPGETGG